MSEEEDESIQGDVSSTMEDEEDSEHVEDSAMQEDASPKKGDKVYKDDEELFDTVFIRNIARFDTTQESLKAHFEENFGETVYCLLCKDKVTGENKGTGFVKFKDPETAGMCLGDFEDRTMQQKFFLDGRNLFVLPALNRNEIGEIKKASAKKEDTPGKKKVKKPRYYRPTKREPDTQESVPKSSKKSDPRAKKKALKRDNRPGPNKRGNFMDKGKGRKGPPAKGGRPHGGKSRKPDNKKGRPQQRGPNKKVKKTKKNLKRKS